MASIVDLLLADGASTNSTAAYNGVANVALPNPKDTAQWLGGGALRNETFAGGELFSLSTPAFANKSAIGSEYNLLAGNILSYVGYGFGALQDVMNTDSLFMDLLYDFEVAEMYMYNVSTTATDSDGNILYESSATYSNDSVEFDTSMSEMSLSELDDAWSNQTNLASMLQGNPITIGMTVFNVLTNQEVSIETRFTGAVIGTVVSTFKGLAMSAASNMLGISGYGALGFGVIFGAVLGELAEMALGLDQAFGYGGEFDKKASKAFGEDAFSESVGFLGVSSMLDAMSYSLGISDSKTVDYSDNGKYVGTSYTSEDVLGEDHTGYGYGEIGAYANYQSTVNMSMAYSTTPTSAVLDSVYGYIGFTLDMQTPMEVSATSLVESLYSQADGGLAVGNGTTAGAIAANAKNTEDIFGVSSSGDSDSRTDAEKSYSDSNFGNGEPGL